MTEDFAVWLYPEGTGFPIIIFAVTDPSYGLFIDWNGTGGFTVSGEDTTPPVFLKLSATPSSIWPPNNKMVPVIVTADVVDDGGPAAARIVTVSCNEPAVGDWQITGSLTLSVRATRNGSGSGRVYTVTVEATDAAGNTATRTVAVSVPHDKGHG